MSREALLHHRILVDGRWIGTGGAGRVTEWFLRGCATLQPPGEWTLFGPSALGDHLWPGARHHQTDVSPLRLGGQASLLLPRRDITLFLHQIRPFTGNPSVTTIYDTIQLHFGRALGLKRRYLKTIAGLSRKVLTTSNASRDRLVRDLGLAPSKLHVVKLPFDPDFAGRVRDLRRRTSRERRLLYVGRFGPHKNLERLVAAFTTTAFRRDDGELLLVGGTPEEVAELRRRVGEVPGVRLGGGCSQADLEMHYATCTAVVLPSLDEGFGLPAWEAMMGRIPVCVSDGGSLPEITAGLVDPFPALSTEAMARAIDGATREDETTTRQRSDAIQRIAPSLERFAEEVADVLGEVLR